MVRFNMILLLIAVVCALGVVTSQHKARKLFQELEGEQERARQLDVEYGQLQLELSTWATHPRIEQIAREKLRMRTPDAVGRAAEPRAAKPAAPAVNKERR
jgi:cell division protein FtsL